MNDLGNILDNIELDAKIKKLQAENKKLRDALKHYETGFKGACPTCEPVGELNKKLTEENKDLGLVLAIYANPVTQDDNGKLAREILEKYSIP